MEELKEFFEILKEEEKKQWEMLKLYKKEFGEENADTQKQLSRSCEASSILDTLEEFIKEKEL